MHLLLVPLVAALLFYLLLGEEEIMPAQIAGGGLIPVGILTSNWRSLAGRG